MGNDIAKTLVLPLVLLSPYIFAAENKSGGLITLMGAIADTTCTINSGKSANFTVALNPISVQDAGTITGPILKNKGEILLTFSNCAPVEGASDTNLKIYFSSTNGISGDGKYLINNTVNENDAAVARNVGFSLASPGSSTPIPLNKPFETVITEEDVTVNSRRLEMDVYYYKTNPLMAKVGELHSYLTYTISYL